MAQERDFKGIWISKDIWLDSRLDAVEKIILAEVDSLDNGEDGCFASNAYLAKFCQCSEWKVSNSISKLIEFGYLEVISFDGRKRTLKSRLVNFTRQTCEIHKADLRISQPSNIVNNQTNKTEEKTKEKDNICENNERYLFTQKSDSKKALYDSIVEKYHRLCPSLSKVQKVTPKREILIRKAYKAYKEEGIEQLFRKVADSDFLSGRASSWKADFEWILDENNAVRILEGKYDNRRSTRSNVKNNAWEASVSCERASDDEIKQAHEKAVEREKNGKRGFF